MTGGKECQCERRGTWEKEVSVGKKPETSAPSKNRHYKGVSKQEKALSVKTGGIRSKKQKTRRRRGEIKSPLANQDVRGNKKTGGIGSVNDSGF